MNGGSIQSLEVMDYAATDAEVRKKHESIKATLEKWECVADGDDTDSTDSGEESDESYYSDEN
jgi:hypothetical protein